MRKTGIICGTIALLFFCSLRVRAVQLTPEEELLKAVASCDFVKVKALIAQNTYLLQIKDRDHRALLHLTARCKDVALARFLIEKKANLNALDPNGWTPLHYAAASNNLSLVKLLIAAHAQVNMTDAAGWTPLFVGNAEIARVLLDNGADLYVEDKEGQTVLHKRPEKALIKLFIDGGLDINVKDYKGRTPLHSAAQMVASYCSPTRNPNPGSSVLRLEDIQALITAGADINAKDSEGVTPLMLGSNYDELVNLLLSKGADINAQDSSGSGVLHRVAQSAFNPPKSLINSGEAQGTSACGLGLDPVNQFAFLLAHGANPNLKDQNGVTPLGALAKVENGSGLVNAARMLLSHNADLEATDKDGNTILHLAAAAGNSELAEFLLKEQGFEPSPKNYSGGTPLHVVADAKTAAVLLKYKANLQLRDNQFESPLYKAVSAGRVELVKLLLKAGADTLYGNVRGETLLHVAARNSDVPIMEMLLKAGIKANTGGPTFRRPLHEAARSSSPNSLEAIKLLVANGADVNLRDKTNSTPLHEVVTKEPSASILAEVKFLLEHGANPNLKNEEGKTPLEVAKEQKLWRANMYSSSANKTENDKVMANVRRLEEVVAVLEKIPVVTVPERRIFGQITMPDGTPAEAIVALRDMDEPATKFEVLAKNGKFEFRLGEGHHFYIMALYDTQKDGAPVRYVGLLRDKTVNGDMGPIEITLDHYVRRN